MKLTETIKKIKQLFLNNSINNYFISEIIDLHFPSTDTEKKKNAEFPTPLLIRKDMLNTIPESFWKNKNNKIFEPCAGKGQFILDIISLFMNGLIDVPELINPEKRYKFIVTNCIYFADINPDNIDICKKIISLGMKNVNLNYYLGDTLNTEFNIQSYFKTNGFNLVIGNPPYNISGKTSTGNTLYQDFIRKPLNEWLLPQGYLLYVTPPAWRKPIFEKDQEIYKKSCSKNYGLYQLMSIDNHMIYLEMHNEKDGQKHFKAGTRYDFYLIQKKSPITDEGFKTTIVIDDEGIENTVLMNEWPWLPNRNFDKVKSLMAKFRRIPVQGTDIMKIEYLEPTVEMVYSTSAYETRKDFTSKEESEIFKYPLVHSTNSKGTTYYWSSRNDRGHFNIPKVIFSKNGYGNPEMDLLGKYGMTEYAMAITGSDLNKIYEILPSENMKKLEKALKWSLIAIEWRVFTSFKKNFYKFI